MEAGGREKVMPRHTLKRVLNLSQEMIMKSQRLRRLTRGIWMLATLNILTD
jgi:hypothetical protein